MSSAEKNTRISAITLCYVFILYTIVRLAVSGQYSRIATAAFALILVLLPLGAEVVLRCRMHPVLYLFGTLYALGPMLGKCYELYYSTGWWDKLLHICGGVMFAILGVYLCQKLSRGSGSLLLCAAFALCLSIAVSAVWEFVEFGCDQLLHTDMQRDSVITAIHSYTLSDTLGYVAHAEGIQTVLVDGAPLPVAGYLDIGLLDTMMDMMLESLGAAVTCAAFLLDRGKHLLIWERTP